MKQEDKIEKTFSQEIAGVTHLPHKSIIVSLDSKSFPLSGNKLYTYMTGAVAAEEYKRCLELLERRLPSEFESPTDKAIIKTQLRLQPIMNVMFVKEMRNQEELKKIASRIVREMFDIPEHINILPELTTDIDLDTEQDDSQETLLSLSQEEQEDMEQEIQKRIILNGLVHGSAMHIWKSAHYIIQKEIDKIDPLLMTLYNEYTASISWLLWEMSPELASSAGGTTQGFNKLEFEENDLCIITCKAINFPVLIHEMTKGAMDYLICHGIPKHFSEEKLKYYYAKADAYDDEIWHYLLSPTMWINLIRAAEVQTQVLPQMIVNLSKISLVELEEIMMACVDGVQEGKLKLKKFKIV